MGTHRNQTRFEEGVAMFKTNFEKLSEAARDENFCVGCLQIRTDVPVTMNLCYQCGGGEIPKEELH